MNDIYDVLKKVKELRDLKTKLKEELIQKQEEFKLKNSELLDNIEAVDRNLSDKEQESREFMINHYTQTGEKKHKLGLGIRITTKLTYDDIQALNYCKSHDFALTYDKKKFDKLAKIQDIEFVQKEEVVTATLPSNIKLGGKETIEE